MLQDSRADLFVSIFFVRYLTPVDWLILADGQVHDRELSVVSQLAHLPLQIVLVVLEEYFLGQKIAVRQLEDLRVKVLLLLRDEQSNLRHLNALFKDISCVFRELQLGKFLLLELTLLHIDDLCKVIMIS